MQMTEFLAVVDSEQSLKEGEAVIQSILERSSRDRAFRDLLTHDTRAAMAHVAGVSVEQVPAFFADIRFVESRADATFVLPAVALGAGELSDAALETVAGGIAPAVLAAYAGYVGLCAAGVWCGKMLAQALT